MSRSLAARPLLVMLPVLCVSLASRAATRADDLLKWVLPSANALVVIDVDAVLASPLAQREGWGTKEHALDRPFVPPQDAQRLLLAALLHPRSLEPVWEAAIVELSEEPSLSAIANAEGGQEDKIGSLAAAWSPRDAYFVRLAPKTLGVLFPGIRQGVARWVAETQAAKGPRLSVYLQQAAGYTDSAGTEIILALDLEDAISPEAIRTRLEQATTLKGQRVDRDALVKLLAGMQGVTLGIQVGEKMNGSLRVDFADNAAPLAAVAKPLVLEALAAQGAMIEDFKDWKARVQGKTVRLDGELSTPGLRLLLSIVELPSPTTVTAEGIEAPQPSPTPQPTSPPEPAAMATASLEHFRAVKELLADLENEGGKSKTLSQIGIWCDRYARKIDRLPVLDVDADLLAYSAEIAERLRQLSLTIRGIGIQSSVAEKQVHGYYGDYGRRYQAGERRASTAPIEAQGATSSQEQWTAIQGRAAEVRRQMSERYKIEF